MGRSRGGLTTKIIVLVDALGYLARFILLPSQRHDRVGVEPLIEDIHFEAVIADKSVRPKRVRRQLNDRGALAVIPLKEGSQNPPFHTTTNGGISSRTASSVSKNGGASQRATTRPTRAFAPSSTSQPPCEPSHECLQTLIGPCDYGPATNPASAAQKSGLSAVGIGMMF